MNSFTRGWYLIYTKPRQEKKVVRELDKQQITSFLPLAKTLRQWHDRKKLVEMPLFPSYVFAKISTPKEYFRGIEVEGSAGFVKFGNKPATVNQAVIDQINIMVNAGKNICVTSDNIMQGQKMLIRNGALTGLEGEVVQYDGKERIMIRVNLLNRAVLVDLPACYLLPAASLQ